MNREVSALERARLEYRPHLPEILGRPLERVGFEEAGATGSVRDEDSIRALFPHTFGRPVLKLGDGTGLDLVDTIERSPTNTRVILVTARGSVETAAFARVHGVFDYLAKPFKIEHLVDRVRAALAPSVPDSSPRRSCRRPARCPSPGTRGRARTA